MGDTPNNGLIDPGAGVGLAPEPLPEKNTRPFIQDLVIEDMRLTYSTGAEQAVKDLEERKAFGIKKYGTALQAFNGRNPMVDAYQECLDALVYLKQASEEAQEKGDMFQKAMIAFEYRNMVGIVLNLAARF